MCACEGWARTPTLRTALRGQLPLSVGHSTLLTSVLPCPFFHVGCSRAGLRFTGLSPPPPMAEHDASDVVGGQRTPTDFRSEEQNRFIARGGLRGLGKLLKQSQIFVKWSKTERLKVSPSLCPKEYA